MEPLYMTRPRTVTLELDTAVLSWNHYTCPEPPQVGHISTYSVPFFSLYLMEPEPWQVGHVSPWLELFPWSDIWADPFPLFGVDTWLELLPPWLLLPWSGETDDLFMLVLLNVVLFWLSVWKNAYPAMPKTTKIPRQRMINSFSIQIPSHSKTSNDTFFLYSCLTLCSISDI